MRGNSEHLNVEIKDSTEGDARTFIITLTAPGNDFHLADLFKHRKVIEPLDPQLKQAIKDSIEKYLSDAESLVSTPATKPTMELTSLTNERRNGKSTEVAIRSLRLTPKR